MLKSKTFEPNNSAETRDLQPELVRMKPWIFPANLPTEAARYFLDDWPCLSAGITSLRTGVGTVRFWSWVQMYVDFQTMLANVK